MKITIWAICEPCEDYFYGSFDIEFFETEELANRAMAELQAKNKYTDYSICERELNVTEKTGLLLSMLSSRDVN